MTVEPHEYLSFLQTHGVAIDSPLTAKELLGIERRFGFSFGSDHAALLQVAVPIGPDWPNWRGSRRALQASLAQPVQGVLFDVENGEFWLESWGPRPEHAHDAVEAAEAHVMGWPRPVPIYSHRYMTAGAAPDAPVLSIHQTDVIVYGLNLLDYLHQEFGSRKALSGWPVGDHLRTPDPWFELVST